jgi:peroxiredoxin
VSEPEAGPPRHRLDPDLAAAGGRPDDEPVPERKRPPAPVIDTRPYRLAIGIFALALVIAFSVYLLTTQRTRSPTAALGHPLRYFAAPLALSSLDGDANVHPPCTLAHHDPRALNVCLLVQRGPLVLAFFVTGSGDCKREIDTLQALRGEFPADQVQFAAVAVGDSHAATKAAVRAHRWTIPVAYDRDGAVAGLYGVQVCPLLELARRGGVVTDVLIGKHWVAPSALEPRVRALVPR